MRFKETCCHSAYSNDHPRCETAHGNVTIFGNPLYIYIYIYINLWNVVIFASSSTGLVWVKNNHFCVFSIRKNK